MGTVLELHITARTGRQARRLEVELLKELAHLESIFSVYNDDSELRRWCRAGGPVSADLAGLLRAGLAWQLTSRGVFNPAIRTLVEVWKAGESSGVPPDPAIVGSLAASIEAPAYTADLERPPTIPLDFNALAKGMAVDLATRRVLLMGARSVMVNLGGEVVHLGDGSTRVGIEHPLRPYDNEPPIAVVELADGALATSGSHRRGFRIGERWFSHVLDPRTGQPVDRLASASITAPDAGTADVVATVSTVLGIDDALSWIESIGAPIGCCLIDLDGALHTNERWRRSVVS